MGGALIISTKCTWLSLATLWRFQKICSSAESSLDPRLLLPAKHFSCGYLDLAQIFKQCPSLNVLGVLFSKAKPTIRCDYIQTPLICFTSLSFKILFGNLLNGRIHFQKGKTSQLLEYKKRSHWDPSIELWSSSSTLKRKEANTVHPGECVLDNNNNYLLFSSAFYVTQSFSNIYCIQYK